MNSDDVVKSARHSDEPPDTAQSVPDSGVLEARIAGRFRVLSLLGRGGMGEVYHVVDDHSGRELALKRLRRDHGRDALPMVLFEREYHTLAQLDHPCVVKVYDYGVDDEGAYYTMQLIRGVSLRDRGMLPWRSACMVLRDVASALAVLHARRWLYRDPSPRNVMCVDGTDAAILIDFGAMSPLGAARRMVGTAPLVPPEAFHQQVLDARADLYGLGALGYWLLCGRHAYPALRFDELPDMWRTSPRPPHKAVADVPPALSQLIMELLSLDRASRPGFASELIERLSVLLGDTQSQRSGAVSAFLTTPKLVGREPALIQARRQLAKTLRGKGSALLVEGEAGVGRSRFLDACVLDAKLLGAHVLRADPSDSASGEYGAVTRLCEQLLANFPHPAAHAARLQRSVLSQVVPSLRESAEGGAAAPQAGQSERRQLQTALRDWFRAVARRHRILLAIDDFDRIDEPSAALLASLVHRNERRRLVVLASVRSDSVGSAAVELLRHSALRIELSPLTLAQSETLLESVFGKARDLAALSQRVHDLSGGNPAQLMQLLEHLVREGHARYTQGSWILPQSLSPAALPASMDAALGLRIDALPTDARELAELLSLRDPATLALGDYPELLGYADHGRVFAAVSALVAGSVLQADGDRYRFAHTRWSQLIEARMADARKKQLHARIAAWLRPRGDDIAVARHAMASDQEALAIELLRTTTARDDLFTFDTLELLKRAVEASERLQLPRAIRCEMRANLTGVSAMLGDVETFLAHVDSVARDLSESSGVTDLPRAPGATQGERIARAFQLADARNAQLPEADRLWSAQEAMIHFGQLLASSTALSLGAMDASLLDRVPDLSQFEQVAPSLFLADCMRNGVRESLAGRRARGQELGRRVLERLEQPDRAGLDPWVHERTRFSMLLAVAEGDVMLGYEQAAKRFAELLEHPGYRSTAWRWQAIYHSMRGETDAARRAERRAELVLLQDGTRQFGTAKTLVAQATVCWLSDDLDGLKQLLDRLDSMAERYPRWRVASHLARAHHQRLTGDLAAALALCEATLPLAKPGGHMLTASVAALHVQLLSANGEVERAIASGEASGFALGAHGLRASDVRSLTLARAEAFARGERFAEAVALCESAIGELTELGAQGVLLGNAFETRARIALAMKDEAAFAEYVERCRKQYSMGDSAALGAKFGRLLRDAEQHGAAGEYMVEVSATSASEAEHVTEMSRMQECATPGERARVALLVALEHSAATEGHLFGLIDGKVTLLASVPDNPLSDALLDALEQEVEAELRATLQTAVTQKSRTDTGKRQARAGLASRFALVPLRGARDGEPVTVAIAALRRMPHYKQPAAEVLSLLADNLLQHDDVDGV